jgi:hypothetical protein
MKKLLTIFLMLFTISASAETAFPDAPNLPTSNDGSIAEISTQTEFPDAPKSTATAASAAYEMKELDKKSQSDMLEQLRASIPDDSAFRDTNGATIDTKIGMVIIQGLSTVAQMIYQNLMDVIVWLLYIFLAFWIGIQAWNSIEGKDNITPKTRMENIAKKCVAVVVVGMVLAMNPAEWLMYLMGGISAIGNYLSDLLLSTTTGVGIARTCLETQMMVVAEGGNFGFLSPTAVANILCTTGNIANFFYDGFFGFLTIIRNSIGSDAMGVFIGVVGAALFILCIFKFAIITLCVIVDIVMGLMFLPFAAFAYCFKSDDWGKIPVVSEVFSGISGAFGGEKLTDTMTKFIHAVIYMVCVALVSSLCFLVLSGMIGTEINLYDGIVNYKEDNEATLILILLGSDICFYLITQMNKIAEMMGGKIDTEWTKKIGDTFTALPSRIGKYAGNISNIISGFKKDKK